MISNIEEFVNRILIAKSYFESTNILLRESDGNKNATILDPLIFSFKHCLELVGKLVEWVLTGSTSNSKHSTSGIVNRTRSKFISKYPVIANYPKISSHQVVRNRSQRRIVEARKDLIKNLDILPEGVKELVICELNSTMQFDIDEINKLLLKYEDCSDKGNTKARYGSMTYSEKNNLVNEIKKDIKIIGTVISFYEDMMWDAAIEDVSVEGARINIKLKK